MEHRNIIAAIIVIIANHRNIAVGSPSSNNKIVIATPFGEPFTGRLSEYCQIVSPVTIEVSGGRLVICDAVLID